MTEINDSRLRNLEARSKALTQVEKNVITLKSKVVELEEELKRVKDIGFGYAVEKNALKKLNAHLQRELKGKGELM